MAERREEQQPRPHLLAGGGEMGALMRAHDWSGTPIGPVENWSPSLRMMAGLLLANRFPLLLWWGPQYISMYNDAYRPILGKKHPRSLAQPVERMLVGDLAHPEAADRHPVQRRPGDLDG